MKNFNTYEKILSFVFQEMDKNKVFYHSKEHVVDALKQANYLFKEDSFQEINVKFDCFKGENYKLKMPFAVFIGLAFHDIVYDIGSTYNEQKSAEKMLSFVKNNLDIEFQEKHSRNFEIAYELILATQKHTEIKNKKFSNLENYWINLSLDIDMSTISKEYNFFLKDSKKIEKEYTQKYSKEEYQEGRKSFLINLLNSNIYITEKFKNRENKAKENIKKFLKI